MKEIKGRKIVSVGRKLRIGTGMFKKMVRADLTVRKLLSQDLKLVKVSLRIMEVKRNNC